MQATLVGRVGRERVFRVPVKVVQTDTMSKAFDQVEENITILARSAAEAANAIRDEVLERATVPTQIIAFGPRGGRVTRFIGWETIGLHAVMSETLQQRRLPLRGRS